MLKRIGLLAIALLAIPHFALANDLPKEDFNRMNPTVRITSYKYEFAGSVTPYGSGSGTVISDNGLVISNNHVIFDDVEQKPLDVFEICITFDVKKQPLCKYTASLVANSKELDVSLLKINEEDVFGNKLPPLKYMNAKNNATPQEQQEMQIVGYPASGGDTITINRGQISGFEKFNSYTYFKTDTDFDHGNSGGTALDKNGNFIGIPTYLRTYAENVGYFLDIREALPWIDENKDAIEAKNDAADTELQRELIRSFNAIETLEYSTESYPQFEIKLPKGWYFPQVGDDGFYAEQKNINDGVGINIMWDNYLFPIDGLYMKKVDEEFAGARERFPDFKKEAVTFAGESAWRITYTAYNQRNTIYLIPYGYSLIFISYTINLDEEAKQWKTLEPVLNAFHFTGSKNAEPNLNSVIDYKMPAFSMNSVSNWRLKKPVGGRESDLLIKGVQKNNMEGQFNVYYGFTPRDERELSPEKKLEEVAKNISDQNAKLVYKKNDVLLDGLKGYLYTVEYEGSKYQQIRKRLTIELQDGDYAFTIQYDDLINNFDKNLPEINEMLNSFKYSDSSSAKKGKYDFGVLGQRFRDIQNHRFATAITQLTDKGILNGYSDGRFRPEFFTRKAEALKIILESKNLLEKEKGLGKEVNFGDHAKKTDSWFKKYVNYMQGKKIIGSNFKPYENITLDEALKWIMDVYEIPVWQGKTPKWHKPYMDKAYELNWLPRGMDDPEQKLTRGELSYLVNTVYNQAK